MKRHVLLLMFSVLTVISGRAQMIGDSEYSDDLINIRGNVQDKTTGEPLEFATVSLLNAADSSLVGGAITEMGGKFNLKAPQGRFILRVQYMSYDNLYINDIVFDDEKDFVDLGEVGLSANSEVLEAVVVSANRDQMQLELDKRIFNVSENVNNVGATAGEIIDNLPSVSVDIEGNVSLRGSSNVQILINGKPSSLVGIDGSAGLAMLQGDLIERIEVITNPSARYDAAGSAGIINIILAKELEKGINGSFTGNVGFPSVLGATGNLNYRRGRFNIFGSYGLSYRSSPGGGYTDRVSYNEGDTIFTYIDNDRLRSGLSQTFRIGSDFSLNDNNIFTISGQTRISNQTNTTDISYVDRDITRSIINNTIRTDTEKEDEDNYEVQATYRHIFNNDGHELTADFQYRSSSEIEKSAIDSANLLSDARKYLYQRSTNNEGDENYLIQVDYVYPFGPGNKFEAGYRGTLREINSNYLVEQVDNVGEWQPLENFSNQFIYDEDVHALYSIFEQKLDKWGYQIGARVEQTFIETYQRETNARDTKNYIDLFPSAFVSYKFSKMTSLQGSYSRRISRPRFWYLNPFSSFSDPRNIRMGNTDLDPEYTDAYELGAVYNLKKASLYLGGYYRFTSGVIERVSTSEDGINTVSTPRNIGTENAFGIEANFSIDPVNWYNVNGNANLYRSITDGSFGDLILSRDTYSARFRLNNRFEFGKVNAQLSANYRAPERTTQGRRDAMYSIDAGVNMDVLKGNGTLNLSARDVFNTRKYRGFTETDNFMEQREFQWRSGEVRLSFVYRLNQKKSRSRGSGERYSGGEGDF